MQCNCGLVFGGIFLIFGCFFEFYFEPCEKQNAFLMGNVPVIGNKRAGSASKMRKTVLFFGIAAQNKKGGDWREGIIKSIFTSFEHLNNVFYTHLFFRSSCLALKSSCSSYTNTFLCFYFK